MNSLAPPSCCAFTDGWVPVAESFTGQVVAGHRLVAPGETSISGEHFGELINVAGPRLGQPEPKRALHPQAGQQVQELVGGGRPARIGAVGPSRGPAPGFGPRRTG